MSAFPTHRCAIDTLPVRPEERVRYWEEQCRANLVGLRCSLHADEGLLAQQICVDAGPLRLGRTRANSHVIERTSEMIRAFPQESIFVNLILSGGIFMYQRGHHAKLQAGDMLVYDARYPYILGGSPSFDLIHVDIPADIFRARLARADLGKPFQISAANGTNRLYHRTLSKLLLGLIDGQPAGADIDHQVCDLLGATMGRATGEAGLSVLSTTHLLAAKAYVEEHLDEEGLRANDIAQAVGVSERHLRRLFAAQGVSLADYLLGRRLDRARLALQDPQQRSATVAETAYRFGFSSHAHFSRAFKQHFGLTPSELLRGRPH